MPSPKFGVALGGGAARGWAHLGVLAALDAHHLSPQIVCGTSAGAFVGAAYVTGQASELDEWARQLSSRDVISLMDVSLGSGGVLAGGKVLEFLRERCGDLAIEELDQPFAAVGTDLESGRELWLQRGPIVDAVRASISLPGILTPVEIDGRWVVDGGLVNPVPVTVCRALGAEIVLAVELGAGRGERVRQDGPVITGLDETEDPSREDFWTAVGNRVQSSAVAKALASVVRGGRSPSFFEVLTRSLHVMQDRIARSRLAGDPPDLLLSPSMPGIRLLDFDRAAEAIEAGRLATEECIPRLRRLLEN